MKALLLLPMLILTLIMTGCGMNPSTPTTTQTGNAVAPAYTVTHTPMGESNGEHIIVSLDSKPIFAKLPENELGSFQALVGTTLVVDYSTSAGYGSVKLFDVTSTGNAFFTTTYYGVHSISGDVLLFDFGIQDYKGAKCTNYDEIAKMGGSVIYIQKKSYNFTTKKEANIGDIYCQYGE